MEREEIEKLKKEIQEGISDVQNIQKDYIYGSEIYISLEIAKSNYYIALTNLI